MENPKHVKQIQTKKGMTANELLKEMNSAGAFGAGAIARAADILEKMVSEKDCTLFFGLAGAMVPGGMRQIIVEMLEDKWADVFVTTGANLTHDLVEALGEKHLRGKSDADDAKLMKKGFDRIFDVYMPNKAYIKVEEFCRKAFAGMPEEMGVKEFLWELGRKASKGSILRTCCEKKIPVFCPGIADSGIGIMAAMHLKKKVLAFKDLKEIMDISWEAKNKGCFYIGGGLPKNFIQQAMQFSPKPANYAVQITTDRAEPGGSSGAPLREGISWGKLAEKAEYCNVFCDATIALPILHAALKERLK